MSVAFLKSLLNHLDENRQYPKYQYERRIDIWISFFLPQVLAARFDGFRVTDMIPEFPVPLEIGNRSQNIDYFVVDREKKQAYVIELKTDISSVRLNQLIYYNSFLAWPWPTLLNKLREIQRHSKHARKYEHLFKRLECLPPNLKINAIFLAPKAAKATFNSSLDRACSMSTSLQSLQDRWYFLPLEEFFSTTIQGEFTDSWSILTEHANKVFPHKESSKV